MLRYDQAVHCSLHKRRPRNLSSLTLAAESEHIICEFAAKCSVILRQAGGFTARGTVPLAAEQPGQQAQQPGVALAFGLWIGLAAYILVIYADKVMGCY